MLTAIANVVAGPQALVVRTGAQNLTLPLAIKVGGTSAAKLWDAFSEAFDELPRPIAVEPTPSRRKMRIVFLLIYVMIFQSESSAEDGKRRLTIGTVGDGLNANGGCTLQLPSQYAKREGLYIFTSDFHPHGLVKRGRHGYAR